MNRTQLGVIAFIALCPFLAFGGTIETLPKAQCLFAMKVNTNLVSGISNEILRSDTGVFGSFLRQHELRPSIQLSTVFPRPSEKLAQMVEVPEPQTFAMWLAAGLLGTVLTRIARLRSAIGRG